MRTAYKRSAACCVEMLCLAELWKCGSFFQSCQLHSNFKVQQQKKVQKTMTLILRRMARYFMSKLAFSR